MKCHQTRNSPLDGNAVPAAANGGMGHGYADIGAQDHGDPTAQAAEQVTGGDEQNEVAHHHGEADKSEEPHVDGKCYPGVLHFDPKEQLASIVPRRPSDEDEGA